MGGWTPRWVVGCDRPDRVILLTLLIGLFGYIDADANLGGCIVGLLAMDSTVDNPASRNKNGATEEGAIFTPRSVRLYKGMLIASIDCFVRKAAYWHARTVASSKVLKIYKMSKISVVFTVHEECGLANVSELCAILERLRPEDIFLETPAEAFDQFFGACTRSNLESLSVRQYKQNKRVELVPIDLPTPNDRFFRDYEYLQRRIEESSPDFRRLRLWYSNYVCDYGFAYLNSEHCSKMWSDIYADMRASVFAINDIRISEIFELWNSVINQRENEMMSNINRHYVENSFETGVFLIGAAHRQSIIAKSEGAASIHQKSIQWDFLG